MVDHDFGNLDEEGRVVAVMLNDVVIHVHKDPEDGKKERNVTDRIQLLSFTFMHLQDAFIWLQVGKVRTFSQKPFYKMTFTCEAK